MKAVCLLAFWLSACGFVFAERMPPGNYHFEGRVVKKADGRYDVSNGYYCAQFPKEKATGLKSYLGKFVDVEFSEIANEFSDPGTTFGEIQRITVIEETPEVFPVLVTIQPTKKRFDVSEPIVAKVTLENRSKMEQSLEMTSSHAVLSKDYDKVFWLEPDNHYYPKQSYRFKGDPDIGKIEPGGRLVFTVESKHMAEPGEYDLSYVICLGVEQRNCVSTLVAIKVTRPADSDRVAVLKSWLKTASLGQRIEIANELAKMGNHWAVDEFLAQLRTGMYLGNGFFYENAYRFAFEYGGEAGEKLMMDLIERDKFQESATTFVRLAFVSKNRMNLLTELLSSKHALEMNLQDWVAGPRICDIAADALMQSTGGKMHFPRNGSGPERNEAVAHVQRALKENPEIFTSLKRE